MAHAPLVDTHAHLVDETFVDDLDGVLDRAATAGVGSIVAVGTDPATNAASVELARNRPGIAVAAGFHPHGAASIEDEDWPALREILDDPRTVAVGEIGLDYHYDFSPRPSQRGIFEQSLALAVELGLPVVIHLREAADDLFAILDSFAAVFSSRPDRIPGVLHCFSGDDADADHALELGFMLSFAGILTFRKADGIRAIAARAPADRLLIETDCPYLAPVPFRGKRNEPARLTHVFEALVEVRGDDPATLARRLLDNAIALFGDCVAPDAGGMSPETS